MSRSVFGWSYPPGVTGNEPAITGEYPVDLHNPNWADENPLEECFTELRGYGVFFGNEEEPRSTHPTFAEVERVAQILNDAIPTMCHFLIADKGRSGCVVCGEPDWDKYAEEQERDEAEERRYQAVRAQEELERQEDRWRA